MKNTERELLPGLANTLKPIEIKETLSLKDTEISTPQKLERATGLITQNGWSPNPGNELRQSEKTLTSISKNTVKEELPSMSLVEESAKHMFEVLKGLNSKNLSDVNAACSVAKTIQGLMRLQLDAIRFAKELKK